MNNKIKWPRLLAETMTGLAYGELSVEEAVANLSQVIVALPPEERGTALLARIIQDLGHAEDKERVDTLLTEAMKLHLCKTLAPEEQQEVRDDPEKQKLVVFLGDVWAPIEWGNKGQRALIIAARRAIGRIKHFNRSK